MKYREKCYNIIENHPDQSKQIKDKMILHNIYALRMNIDLGFKQFMMKRLNQVIQTKINKDSFKRLLVSILDELQSPPEQFFDIFDNNSIRPIEINLETITQHKEQLYKIRSIEEYYRKAENKDVEFLKILLNFTELNTTLCRSLEDFIIEFESGIFHSRYFKEGEVRRFLLYNFNRYIILLLEHRYGNLYPVFSFNLPLLRLIPEFYLNLVKINKFLFQSLNELFTLPKDLHISSFSMLSIHFMSIFMTLIFEDFSFEEKLDSLNRFYKFEFKFQDISSIAENVEHYENTTFNLKELNLDVENLEIEKSKLHLLSLGRTMFTLGLHEYSIIIYKYLFDKEKNEKIKTLFLDNIATGYRDLGENEKSIELYEECANYYKKSRLNYQLFVAKKNIAYCYYQLGSIERSNQIFDELEGNLSIYSKEELLLVYYNLAFRYRLNFQFEKEEYYHNLALENMEMNHPNYQEILDRSLEIGEYFNLNTGKLDSDELRKLEIDRDYQNNMRRAYMYLNNYNLDLGKFFLKQAYKRKDPDGEYWRFLSNISTLKEKWNDLYETGEKILKTNSHDFFGYFYNCLYYIHKKDNDNLLISLLEIKSMTKSFLYSNPLAYERMSNVLYFICRSYSKEEIINFINYAFTNYEKDSQENSSIIELMLFFAVIFTNNREKFLSGLIYKKCMELMKTKEAINLYAGWCYRFNDYSNSKYFYKKALSLSPKEIETLERLSRVSLMLNDFNDSLKYIDEILKLCPVELKESFENFKNHIILIRDEKIRYENLPFNDVKTIFNTFEYQLKNLDHTKDIEFGIILTQISKGIENLLAKTLGMQIYEFVKDQHFPIPQIYREGNNQDIKPIHILFLNFLNNPSDHNPTLGNWNYIIKGTLENLNPQNPIMQDIYDFLSQQSNVEIDKLKTILNLSNVFLKDRNLATHKKLYTKEEVQNILKKIVPLINNYINLTPMNNHSN